MTPADRDKGTWPLEPASAIPALNEADMTDKPAWLADNPEVDALDQRQKLTEQHEASMSVDDGVARIIDALGTRVSNTLIIYVSDNGYMLGSHRLTGKDMPHIRSTEVPMFVRWDGKIASNTVLPRVTPQIDLTATIAQAAGITGWTMEGRSIFSSLNPVTYSGRAGTVIEQVQSQDFGPSDSRWHPSYCGWRTARYLFVEYGGGQGRELYDYDTDPDELVNRASDPAYASILTDLRNNAIAACSPVPPGFTWG
jgi:arylsulfatase A-like enzyme